MKIGKHTVNISNPDKILFPNPDITKQEFIEYYANCWEYIAPHLKDRPLSLHRFPDGIIKEGFYQKEMPNYFPDYVESVWVEDQKDGMCYPMINNKASLVYIANLASIPLHTWESRKKKLHYPDQVIFDLDPPEGSDFEKVKEGARLLKYLLEEIEIEPWIKTSGSKGLHLCIPVKPDFDYDEIKAFTKSIAEFMSAKLPTVFTTELSKAKRKGRIFLDYLRNQYGHTAVAAYAVRALPKAPVAVPITWDELENKKMNPQFVNIRNFDQRIKEVGDLWANFYDKPQSLKKPMKNFQKVLDKNQKK